MSSHHSSSPSDPRLEHGSGVVEFTKDGNVSRMRSHKGNIPSLPQSKLCPLCPAKFTRTTHLNRHLRTHSNERLHECDRCHSQFTRSDLLSRHKRSCGDPSSAHRSRRKSCQACAESKVKCDQQQPCLKCQTRGRECVYRVPLVPHSARRSAPRMSSPLASAPPEGRGIGISRSNPQTYAHTATGTMDDPFCAMGTSGSRMTPAYTPRSAQEHSEFTVSPPLTFDARSMMSGSHASSTTANSDFTSDYDEQPNHFSFAQEAVHVQNHLNALFSNEMFDKFFNNNFPHGSPTHNGLCEFISPEVGTPRGESYFFNPDFPFPTNPADVQPFVTSIEPLDYETFRVFHSGGPGPQTIPTPPVSRHVTELNKPTPAELQYYLQLFVTSFLNQMPVVHGPTFSIEGKPQILVSAMQACGALYVRTPTAARFIDNTLCSAREQVVVAFTSSPESFEDRIHLILAVGLLQCIGLFHNRPEQRKQSTVYHGMLVTMVRQSGLMQHNANWTPMPLDDLTAAWKNWILHETAKRALSLSFLHDCCHTIFFNIPPTFLRDEVNILLPCENALWKAGSALEWHYVLTQSSAYGSTTLERLRGGPPTQSAISRLAAIPTNSQTPLIMNPFSQFIIIHAILRFLFEDCLENIQTSQSPPQSTSTSPTNTSFPHRQSPSPRYDDSTHGGYSTTVNPIIQYMLHNWLQSYFTSPSENLRNSSCSSGRSPTNCSYSIPIFAHDGLPFYWIAQVSLLAFQEGLPPFASSTRSLNASGEAKFNLMKQWFKHIREFLQRGEQGPTLFWDELMKIRLDSLRGGEHAGLGSGSGGGEGGGVEGPNGILEFFHGGEEECFSP